MAWSGGLDSTVLLHLLVRARREAARFDLRAIHVDHGLQPAARDFRDFCRRNARALRVPLTVVKADVRRMAGDSLEAAARAARYVALDRAIRPGELLLTAQHADDQLETFLLALLRGAGPAGLAAMPQVAPFGATRLIRPLLGEERVRLADYAERHQLAWQDDPSNALLRFDRNYLRERVLPALRQRWPAAAKTASRSAAHCAAAAAAITRLARLDLEEAMDGPALEIAVLRRWRPARRAAVLREWIAGAGLALPGQRHLEQIFRMMDARQDAQPSLRLPGAVVRRHAGRFLLDLREEQREAVPRSHRWSWGRGTLRLGDSELGIVADPHGDLDLDRLPPAVRVQYPSAPGGREWRKLMQELEVPDWQRAQLPLVFAIGRQPAARRLLAVADLWATQRLHSTAASIRRGRFFWREQR